MTAKNHANKCANYRLTRNALFSFILNFSNGRNDGYLIVPAAVAVGIVFILNNEGQ